MTSLSYSHTISTKCTLLYCYTLPKFTNLIDEALCLFDEALYGFVLPPHAKNAIFIEAAT